MAKSCLFIHCRRKKSQWENATKSFFTIQFKARLACIKNKTTEPGFWTVPPPLRPRGVYSKRVGGGLEVSEMGGEIILKVSLHNFFNIQVQDGFHTHTHKTSLDGKGKERWVSNSPPKALDMPRTIHLHIFNQTC